MEVPKVLQRTDPGILEDSRSLASGQTPEVEFEPLAAPKGPAASTVRILHLLLPVPVMGGDPKLPRGPNSDG